MASEQDNANRRSGMEQANEEFNLRIAQSQSEKTSFRAQKVSVNADPFASGRLPIQQDRY